MRVAVGSTNPVKREATAAALGERANRIAAVAVDSGVAEQPRGVVETLAGAENRARGALSTGDYDLGVGIEGGVARYGAADGLFLIMWAAATDGDRTGRGAGPSIPLPEGVGARIEAGAELGPVMDDLTGVDDVARKQGAAGVFTGGTIDRETALATAVAGAVGPFVTEHF